MQGTAEASPLQQERHLSVCHERTAVAGSPAHWLVRKERVGGRSACRNKRRLEQKRNYRAGELVAESGIYEAQHSDGKQERRAVLRGSRFPECPVCGTDVSYRLLYAAPYIFEDPDFEPNGT